VNLCGVVVSYGHACVPCRNRLRRVGGPRGTCREEKRRRVHGRARRVRLPAVAGLARGVFAVSRPWAATRMFPTVGRVWASFRVRG
jgi:hypothetical protein